MLIENTLFGVRDKVQIAIERLKEFEPPEGYYVAFSGGKDSCVVKELARMSGVKFDTHHSHTNIDPPELIYFIRKHHADVEVHRPPKSFWELFERWGPPDSRRRWCCGSQKETGGRGRMVVTGVRWAESHRRSTRQMVEACYADNSKRYLHPIIDWSESDVWEFIGQQNLPYCSLYDEGFSRIGCIMCPLQSHTGVIRDMARWPQYANNYRAACNKSFEFKKNKGKEMIWASGDEMYEWWVAGRGKAEDDTTQQRFFFED